MLGVIFSPSLYIMAIVHARNIYFLATSYVACYAFFLSKKRIYSISVSIARLYVCNYVVYARKEEARDRLLLRKRVQRDCVSRILCHIIEYNMFLLEGGGASCTFSVVVTKLLHLTSSPLSHSFNTQTNHPIWPQSQSQPNYSHPPSPSTL